MTKCAQHQQLPTLSRCILDRNGFSICQELVAEWRMRKWTGETRDLRERLEYFVTYQDNFAHPKHHPDSRYSHCNAVPLECIVRNRIAICYGSRLHRERKWGRKKKQFIIDKTHQKKSSRRQTYDNRPHQLCLSDNPHDRHSVPVSICMMSHRTYIYRVDRNISLLS